MLRVLKEYLLYFRIANYHKPSTLILMDICNTFSPIGKSESFAAWYLQYYSLTTQLTVRLFNFMEQNLHVSIVHDMIRH